MNFSSEITGDSLDIHTLEHQVGNFSHRVTTHTGDLDPISSLKSYLQAAPSLSFLIEDAKCTGITVKDLKLWPLDTFFQRWLPQTDIIYIVQAFLIFQGSEIPKDFHGYILEVLQLAKLYNSEEISLQEIVMTYIEEIKNSGKKFLRLTQEDYLNPDFEVKHFLKVAIGNLLELQRAQRFRDKIRAVLKHDSGEYEPFIMHIAKKGILLDDFYSEEGRTLLDQMITESNFAAIKSQKEFLHATLTKTELEIDTSISEEFKEDYVEPSQAKIDLSKTSVICHTKSYKEENLNHSNPTDSSISLNKDTYQMLKDELCQNNMFDQFSKLFLNEIRKQGLLDELKEIILRCINCKISISKLNAEIISIYFKGMDSRKQQRLLYILKYVELSNGEKFRTIDFSKGKYPNFIECCSQNDISYPIVAKWTTIKDFAPMIEVLDFPEIEELVEQNNKTLSEIMVKETSLVLDEGIEWNQGEALSDMSFLAQETDKKTAEILTTNNSQESTKDDLDTEAISKLHKLPEKIRKEAARSFKKIQRKMKKLF